jgi:acylpyruvate hydrolase
MAAGAVMASARRIEGDLLGDHRVTDEVVAIEQLLAPLVPTDILCIGVNYRAHAAETGSQVPQNPMLFIKASGTLNAHGGDIVLPRNSATVDYEAELAVVIGKAAYQVSEADAADYIAGYSVINDYTMRDYQTRTLQWDQGKTFEKTAGFGPFLVTDYALGTQIEARLDGEVMQSANTEDLLFTPAALVDYISHIVTLQPGDVIITGTTGGVGAYRTPPVWMKPGDTVEVEISGVGLLRNTVVQEG